MDSLLEKVLFFATEKECQDYFAPHHVHNRQQIEELQQRVQEKQSDPVADNPVAEPTHSLPFGLKMPPQLMNNLGKGIELYCPIELGVEEENNEYFCYGGVQDISEIRGVGYTSVSHLAKDVRQGLFEYALNFYGAQVKPIFFTLEEVPSRKDIEEKFEEALAELPQELQEAVYQLLGDKKSITDQIEAALQARPLKDAEIEEFLQEYYTVPKGLN